MIDNQFGRYIIICDNCGDESADFDSFQDAVDARKVEGFTTIKKK